MPPQIDEKLLHNKNKNVSVKLTFTSETKVDPNKIPAFRHHTTLYSTNSVIGWLNTSVMSEIVMLDGIVAIDLDDTYST